MKRLFLIILAIVLGTSIVAEADYRTGNLTATGDLSVANEIHIGGGAYTLPTVDGNADEVMEN